MSELFGKCGELADELRERFPALRADCGYAPRPAPHTYLKVAGYDRATRVIVWDGGLGAYRWSTGPDAGGQVGVTVPQAAEAVARALGAPIP